MNDLIDTTTLLDDNDFCRAVQAGSQIDAVKRYRVMHSVSLKASRDAVIPRWNEFRLKAYSWYGS